MLRETLLYKLAVCYATIGHREEGLQVIGMMDSQDQQHRALAEIAKLYVRTGNNSQVFEVTEMIRDDYARVLCEMEIVDAFIASGQPESISLNGNRSQACPKRSSYQSL